MVTEQRRIPTRSRAQMLIDHEVTSMMRKIMVPVAAVALLGLAACGNTMGERAGSGALIGAGGGAAAGAALGNPLAGALVGGAVGAGVGAATTPDEPRHYHRDHYYR
jgi:hypothetical protein